MATPTTSRIRSGRWRPVAVVASLALLAACGGDGDDEPSSSTGPTTATTGGDGEPVAGGSIVIGRGAAIEGWDGAQAFTSVTYNTLNMVVPPLAQIDPATNEPVPGIAADWEFSADDTELTVTLDPAATFSNGDPVTPADVVFSFEQWKNGPYQGFYWSPVERATAGEDGTVVFTSSGPNTSIDEVMTLPAFGVYPEDFGGLTAEEYFAAPIGAGPYVIVSEDIGEEIVLEANPYYQEEGKPYLEGITLRTIADPNQRLLQFESGDVQLLDTVPTDLVPQLDDGAYVATPSSLQLFLLPNWRSGPGNDAGFREALSKAVDRETLIEGVLGAFGHEQAGVTPRLSNDQPGPSSGSWDDFDPDAARTALDGSGYDGRELTMLVDNTRATGVLMAQAVVQQLGDVGIDVRLEEVDTATYIERWTTSYDFDLVLGLNYATTPTVVDPFSNFTFLEWIFSGAPTDVVGGAYESAVGADAAGIEALTTEVEDWALEHRPFVPLANLDIVTARIPELQGLTVDRMGYIASQNLYLSE